MGDSTPRKLIYLFEFDEGTTWRYELQFDKKHHFVPRPEVHPKPWTALEYHQCSNCPLNKSEFPQCPVARNLDQMVEDSKSTLSWTRARVTVESPERLYKKECATQDGLRSLFGVVMASSNCPHLDWLRPLARFHLPFADLEETLFRSLSLQLLDDFLNKAGGGFEESITRLNARYLEVEKVNHSFVDRIRTYCQADADKNAIAALDISVQLFPYQLSSNFQSLRTYFEKE